ncbi:MAG: hypothetical protein ITD31_04305 [Nitrosospira sp.]|nr:hypothetical protein [Nitrosospira sp.]
MEAVKLMKAAMRHNIALNQDAPQAFYLLGLEIGQTIRQTRHLPYAYGKLHPVDG